MGRMRTLGRLAVASSDELTLGQQVAKWGLDGTIGAVVSFVLSTVIGWVAGYPLCGLVIGAVMGMVIVVALSYKAVTVAMSGEESAQPRRRGIRPHAEGEPNDADLPFPLPRDLPPDWRLRQTLFDEPRPGEQESMWYELQPVQTSRWLTGVVGTERCVFRDCAFVDIGIMADNAQIAKLKNHIAGGGDAEILS